MNSGKKKGIIAVIIIVAAVIIFFVSQLVMQKMAVNDGVDYLKDEQYEKAYNSFVEAEKKHTLFTSKSNILYYEGECLMKLERFDEAADVYDQISENKALVLKGLALQEAGDTENAVKCYQQAISDEPKDGMGYYYLYAYYLSINDKVSALDTIEQAESQDLTNMKQEIDYAQIVIYEKMVQYDTALEKAQEYVKAYPDDEKGKHELEFLETR